MEKGKMDFLKYLSRSFLLPLAGMICTFLMAFYGAIRGNELLYFGGLMAVFCGIFNINEAFKTWVAERYKK